MTIDTPGWIKDVPDFLSVANERETHAYLTRLSELAEERESAIPNTPMTNKRITLWPRSPVEVRLIPGGVAPHYCVNSGMSYISSIARAMRAFGTDRVAVWGLGFEEFGVFIGHYNQELCEWIKGRLLYSPTVIVGADVRLFLFNDEQLHYAVLGMEKEIAREFDGGFGGHRRVTDEFNQWVADGEIGFDDLDQQWANNTILSWYNRHSAAR
jgi:hypothetical protein